MVVVLVLANKAQRPGRPLGDDRDMSIDDYGLPVGILGRHPDEFYAAMGRIVCVCAVLEQQLTIMRHALARVEPGKFTHEPVNGQIKAARALSRGLSDPGGERIGAFLDRASLAFERRNAVVHSAFPAQADGRIWGHRPARARTVLDGTADTVEMSLADLRAQIAELSTLVDDFGGAFAYCS